MFDWIGQNLVQAAEWVGKLFSFMAAWLRSRRWLRMAAGILPIGFVVAAGMVAVHRKTPEYRESMYNWYCTLGEKAVLRRDTAGIHLAFRRAASLARDQNDLRYEYAVALCDGGAESEGLHLMSLLAPLRGGGLPKAHQFLVDRLPQDRSSDVLRAVHLIRLLKLPTYAESSWEQLAPLLLRYGQSKMLRDVLESVSREQPRFRVRLALELLRQGMRDEARVEFKSAVRELSEELQTDNDKPLVRLALAEAMLQLADPGGALIVLHEGVDRQFHRGGQLQEAILNDYAQSIEGTLRIWLQLMPEGMRNQQLEALCSVVSGVRPSEGAAVLAKEAAEALSSNERDGVAAVLIGGAMMNGVRYQEGLSLMLRAADRAQVESGLVPPVLLNNMAWACLQAQRKGETSAVRELFSEAGWLTDSAEGLIRLGVELSGRAVALADGQPGFHHTRGLLTLAAGDPAAAITDLELCLAARYQPEGLHEALGTAYSQTGNTEQALVHFELAKESVEGRTAGSEVTQPEAD